LTEANAYILPYFFLYLLVEYVLDRYPALFFSLLCMLRERSGCEYFSSVTERALFPLPLFRRIKPLPGAVLPFLSHPGRMRADSSFSFPSPKEYDIGQSLLFPDDRRFPFFSSYQVSRERAVFLLNFLFSNYEAGAFPPLFVRAGCADTFLS